MELKEYVTIIKKNFKIIIITGVLVGLSSFLFTSVQPLKYETSMSLFINKKDSQETDNFKYDGYYALQTSEMLSDTIIEWTKSPEFVNSVYAKAGVDLNFNSIKKYLKAFNVKKMSSQYIKINFISTNKAEAVKISSAISSEIKEKIKTIENESEKEISFSVTSEDPIIIVSKPKILINLIIGIFSGLIIGIFFVFTKRYFS
ncbi:MAG: Wzz/FepE/Etk N-terminal domain-containing protein [Patescibacteria group bacterium]|nr:Wzz/FepE/Etk N-terminal domain-containing protein [Patescibacteria group bacterium]